MGHMRSVRLVVASFIVAAILNGCGGGGDNGGGGPPDDTPASVAIQAGNNQTALVSTPVTTDPAVLVRNAGNEALAGVAVTFAVATGGGSVSGAAATTNDQGVATVGSWTLGPSVGANTLTATVAGLNPVTFTATGSNVLPSRKWTVMVFMAADNNLAVPGILDIDEMEAAGVSSDVQVLVQAEFSPSALAQYNCDASCFNRPNFNTFRYAVTDQGSPVNGPNGSVTDLGNRNMTDPAQINEFVLWAKQNYPADHYALVLWNHGGGYVGLLQDETSAGSDLMSIGELPAALQGTGAIDVLDFDMCLMGGYETLVKIAGLADYAVFSEEVVPGAGNPYQTIIDAIQANASGSARTIATIFVDQFDLSYQGDRASTTKSAYELSGFAAFETALDAVASTLQANLNTFGPAIGTALSQSQKYSYRELTDLVALLDNLKAGITDATLDGQIDALKALATGTFRVANKARTGTSTEAADMSGSTGLNIVIPSGVGPDQLAATGPQSLASYQALYPGKAWTLFLTDWVTGQGTTAKTDQGNNRFEAYLVWDPGAVAVDADVDLWILEPDGSLFIPYLGSVSPNGVMSSDSDADGVYFEGYLTNRFVDNGTFKFYANLWKDPQAFMPEFDLVYRNDQSQSFTSLYDPNFPILSTQVSWLDDPTPTYLEIEAGAYTDLQYVAILGFPSPPVGVAAAESPSGRLLTGAAAQSGPGITPAQLMAARRWIQSAGPAARPSLQRRGNAIILPTPRRNP